MGLKVSASASPVAGGRFRLVLHTAKRFSFDSFLDFAEKSSTVTRADALAVLERAATWVVLCAAQGRECDLGVLGRSRLGLKGIFDQRPERILDDDVRLTVSWVLPRDLHRQVGNAGAHLTRDRVMSAANPQISMVRGFVALTNGWITDQYQAGSILMLTGSRLKFDRGRLDEGVFLRRAEGNDPWLRVSQYLEVFPRTILCGVPTELGGSGGLTVEIRRRRRASQEHPRFDRYETVLQEALPASRQAAVRSGTPHEPATPD